VPENYRIVPLAGPACGIIAPAISGFNKQQAGDAHSESLCFAA